MEKPTGYEKSAPGRLRSMDGYWAFIPNPLPPALSLSWELADDLVAASRSLAELQALLESLPNPRLLTEGLARREAVQSSRIEGTATTVRTLVEFEAYGEIERGDRDAREVLNYVRALEHSIARLDELPLCLRIVREAHGILLRGVRGDSAAPGEFRQSPVWIGGRTPAEARYVPPPAEELPRLLGDWERHLHLESPLPLLIRIALEHYQFEAIHPFLDGNGRTGRLLILLQLHAAKLLSAPVLDLSDYIERNRLTYYQLLTAVSEKGAWDQWIHFMLRGFHEQAQIARDTASVLLALRERFRRELQKRTSSMLVLQIVDFLFETPWMTSTSIVKRTGKSYNAVKNAFGHLENLGFVQEITGKGRDRIYIAPAIVDVLEPSP